MQTKQLEDILEGAMVGRFPICTCAQGSGWLSIWRTHAERKTDTHAFISRDCLGKRNVNRIIEWPRACWKPLTTNMNDIIYLNGMFAKNIIHLSRLTYFSIFSFNIYIYKCYVQTIETPTYNCISAFYMDTNIHRLNIRATILANIIYI